MSKLRIRNQQDFVAGLIYVATGLAFALGAMNYKIGEAARMGPGYFPFFVGMLLAAVGFATSALALKPAAAEVAVKVPDLRTMAWVLGAVVLFGLLLQPAGLVIALVALVLVSSMASHEFAWRGALVNTLVLVIFSVGAFIKGISLQIPLWPAFLN
ncbi:MAG: tripartite tricarboxylate transporter TctB family protein [Burkholderiales bacterium]|nr:tripartite tricarboxylate transporter TctB family protein [Burkholderiales bacterium]